MTQFTKLLKAKLCLKQARLLEPFFENFRVFGKKIQSTIEAGLTPEN
jgi:hypothetical protein